MRPRERISGGQTRATPRVIIDVSRLVSSCSLKMVVRPTSGLTSHVNYVCNKVRFASMRTQRAIKTKPADPDHGRHIYVYHQFQTNQVVYSLTKSLKVFMFSSTTP